ncbi:hypothetical protein HK405_015692, partial [Cladochytrium tenue]
HFRRTTRKRQRHTCHGCGSGWRPLAPAWRAPWRCWACCRRPGCCHWCTPPCPTRCSPTRPCTPLASPPWLPPSTGPG